MNPDQNQSAQTDVPDEVDNHIVEESISSSRCYSAEDIACILNVSMPTVYALLKRKEFRWRKVAGKYRISRKSFDEWLDQ